MADLIATQAVTAVLAPSSPLVPVLVSTVLGPSSLLSAKRSSFITTQRPTQRTSMASPRPFHHQRGTFSTTQVKTSAWKPAPRTVSAEFKAMAPSPRSYSSSSRQTYNTTGSGSSSPSTTIDAFGVGPLIWLGILLGVVGTLAFQRFLDSQFPDSTTPKYYKDFSYTIHQCWEDEIGNILRDAKPEVLTLFAQHERKVNKEFTKTNPGYIDVWLAMIFRVAQEAKDKVRAETGWSWTRRAVRTCQICDICDGRLPKNSTGSSGASSCWWCAARGTIEGWVDAGFDTYLNTYLNRKIAERLEKRKENRSDVEKTAALRELKKREKEEMERAVKMVRTGEKRSLWKIFPQEEVDDHEDEAKELEDDE